MEVESRHDVRVDARRRAGFTVPALRESVGLARRIAEVVLRTWMIPVDEFTAVLLLSEVFTNALMHGVDPLAEATRIIVDLVETETGLRVEVHDPNMGKQGGVVVSRATAGDESGRGLRLVEELASGWGCEYTDGGKVVFFDVDLVCAHAADISECLPA